MTKISREEVLNIARMSAIALREEEIAPLIDQIEQMISYARRVTQVAIQIEEPSMKNVNIMRRDVAILQDPEPILARAPERAGNYFVVPKILDNN